MTNKTKCTCWEFRQKYNAEREAEVYAEIDKIIAKMDETELRKEIRPLMRYKTVIMSFPCMCFDMEDDCT